MGTRSIKEMLVAEWVEETEKLKSIGINAEKEKYKLQAERVAHLEKQLVDLEKTELDVEERAAGRDIEEQSKIRQAESEEKTQKTRNKIEVAKITVPVVAAFTMGLISMVWEKTDTLTSTAGKNGLRELIRFKP